MSYNTDLKLEVKEGSPLHLAIQNHRYPIRLSHAFSCIAAHRDIPKYYDSDSYFKHIALIVANYTAGHGDPLDLAMAINYLAQSAPGSYTFHRLESLATVRDPRTVAYAIGILHDETRLHSYSTLPKELELAVMTHEKPVELAKAFVSALRSVTSLGNKDAILSALKKCNYPIQLSNMFYNLVHCLKDRVELTNARSLALTNPDVYNQVCQAFKDGKGGKEISLIIDASVAVNENEVLSEGVSPKKMGFFPPQSTHSTEVGSMPEASLP